jgi:hypothetical protein
MTCVSNSDRGHTPAQTWVGLAVIIAAEIAIWLGCRPVATWFTPIQWTGYILLADGLVHRLTGSSWLTRQRREFPFLALSSVLLWLGFEAYNLHLRNWAYLGVPAEPWLRDLAYFWSFATIVPGVFETGDLIAALARRRRVTVFTQSPPSHPALLSLWVAVGAVCVSLPLLLPSAVAAYLFGLVWVGFVPLLDPLNARRGLASLSRAWRDGNHLPAWALLGSGMVCGLLWETWNYQAFLAGGGHWIYTIPEALRPLGLHFGRMPVLGLLGFPPFALELYALYSRLRQMVGGDRLLGRTAASPSRPAGPEPSGRPHSPGNSKKHNRVLP